MVRRRKVEEDLNLESGVSAAKEILLSSPLRRKSLKNLSSRFEKSSEVLPENDDEAERRERRRQSESFGTLRDKRVSLGGIADFTAAELVAHYANCIKLSTENKINTKNAFSLQLIDYMSAMLKKKDSAMNNFQVASCTLDASTKIYASRVDRVHMDVFKMAGGLGVLPSRKKKPGKDEDEDDDGGGGEDDEEGNSSKRFRRARKPKRCVAKNEEGLNAVVEQDYRLDPMYMYMNSKFGDSQPGFINFMGHMNLRDDNCELMMFPNERYWQKLQSEPSKPSSVEVPTIPDLSGKAVSIAFRGLFLNEDESSPDFLLPETQPDSDLEMDVNDEPEDHYENGMMDEAGSDVDETMGTEAPPVSCRALPEPSSIVDIREHLSMKPLEYSYFNIDRLSLWAGPGHWKIRPFSKDKMSAVSKNTTEKREKKNLELNFNDLENVGKLYIRGKSLLMSKRTMEKTWCVEKNTNPHDEHYDEKNLTRLFLRKCHRLLMSEQSERVSTNEDRDVAEYDYNNLNDSQEYCPDVMDGDDQRGDDGDENYESHTLADDVHSAEHAAVGWKLVTPPPKVARVIIPYATMEKKLNMKKLKGAIWDILTRGEADQRIVNHSDSQSSDISIPAEDVRMSASVLFSELYRRLLVELPKSLTQDLSIHITFTALLHLSNEKVLSLKGNSDYSDILITQDN
ncbi:condensin complex subunit 2 [Anabrus simplex]|uniref:condensin complex subunit 2 n=1 Tax=Anabrus simplex TaxID=316456 RepID=UPI0034DDC508